MGSNMLHLVIIWIINFRWFIYKIYSFLILWALFGYHHALLPGNRADHNKSLTAKTTESAQTRSVNAKMRWKSVKLKKSDVKYYILNCLMLKNKWYLKQWQNGRRGDRLVREGQAHSGPPLPQRAPRNGQESLADQLWNRIFIPLGFLIVWLPQYQGKIGPLTDDWHT